MTEERTDADPVGAPAWLRALRDSTFVFAGVCDLDGVLLDANRLALDECGFGTEQLGRPFWDTGWWAGHADVRKRIRVWCERVAAGGDAVRQVVPYSHADGRERKVDLSVQRMAPDEGSSAAVLVSGMDVTDRFAEAAVTEARLSRALSLSERILDTVADGIYGLDDRGRVQFVNPAAVRITGYGAAEQLGRDQHELLHARRRDGAPYPKEECPVWTALTTGRTVVAEHEFFWRSDGTAVPVELIAVPMVEDGRATGLVVSFRDLTDRLAAQQQAAELERLSMRAAAQRALSDRLQEALLTPPPEPDHLHVVVRYLPAAHEAQVGGDWYDAFLQPDGATMLVIGDVVGHDSSAAAAMGQLRGLVRALAYDNEEPPSATLSRVDRTARGLAVGSLATAVLARIERRPDVPVAGRRRLRWSNAGHLPPVLLAADGSSRLLETPPELMLGVDPHAPRSDTAVDLPDGDTLLLVTDGLVERRGSDLDQGMAAMREAVRDLGRAPLEELCDTLLRRLVPAHAEDDVAVVAVRAYPEDRPRPPEAGPNRVPDTLP